MPENEKNDAETTGTSASVIAAMEALKHHEEAETNDDDEDDDALPASATPKTVDSDSIRIAKDYSIDEQKVDVMNLFGSRPSFQVVCSQSGYMAKMTSLLYSDVFNMTSSNLSNYETKKQIYRIIYSKIAGFSAPEWRPTFDEWLKATSFGDLDTLYYGLYCSTFQEKSSVTFECPVCGFKNTVEIDNSQLVRVNDKDEMMALTTKISNEAVTASKISEFSLLADRKENYRMIELPNSKLIFKLRLPSLWDVLELIRTTSDEQLAAKSPATINIALMASKCLLPKTGKDKKPVDPPMYSEVASKKDIFGILDLISIDDYAAINSATAKMLEDKHIDYEIEGQECSSCKTKLDKIPMDMETLLFFQIRERRL